MFILAEIVLVLVFSVPLIIGSKRRKAFRELSENGTAGKRRSAYPIVFVALLLLIVFWNIYLGIFVNRLWFDSKGYLDVFNKTLTVKWVMFAVGFLLSFVIFFTNFSIALKSIRGKQGDILIALTVSAGFALIMGSFLSGQWNIRLLNRYQAVSEITEPVFGRSVSYYLFSLHLKTGLLSWATALVVVPLFTLLAGCLIGVIIQAARKKKKRSTGPLSFGTIIVQLFILGAIWALLLAIKQSFNIDNIVFGLRGMVAGAGFTDLHAGIFGLRAARIVWLITMIILALSAVPRVRHKMYFREEGKASPGRIVAVPISLGVIFIMLRMVIPGIQQGLRVLPDELNAEMPYIDRNIQFTRTAYSIGAEDIEEREISVGRTILPEVIETNRTALASLRLWDYRALSDYLKEYQEIKPYYEFNDVDVDRYRLGGNQTEVMLAVRELNTSQLDERARTWINRTLKYTHGYGLAMAPANDFISGGQPNLIIKNLPMETSFEELKIEKPQIYYGELTDTNILTSPLIDEFDFPVGDENAYINYDGSGGIFLDSGWKKFCFAWRLNSHQMLFSPGIDRETRIHLDRSITTMVRKIAPWLKYDTDPYAVLSGGRVRWIMDAFTVSGSFPYSAYYYGSKTEYHGINYISNAAKIVIDAYDGSIRFYLFDQDDPIIQTYTRIFPSLFAPSSEMPPDIRAHLRYPEEFFTVQLEMYETYHMKNTEVFYTKEDVWERPKEKYHQSDDVVVEPYYIIASLPSGAGDSGAGDSGAGDSGAGDSGAGDSTAGLGESVSQFILMSPYTPLEKNVLRSWLCAGSDGDNYGKLIIYKFPKGEEIKGPRMIESRIDQDSEMSQVLSLWNQKGSQVLRGNLLVVPLFYGDLAYLLYVEPVFLQADGAKMPELKKIVLSDQDRIVWGDSFEEALTALTGSSAGVSERGGAAGAMPDGAAVAYPEDSTGIFNSLKGALNRYKALQGEGKFAEAGRELEKIYDMVESSRSGR